MAKKKAPYVSPSQLAEIIELIRLGHDLKEIAGIMGVSLDTVCDINESL